MLHVQHLRFRYRTMRLPDDRDWFLSIDDLSIDKGQAYSLYGDNMSGKTTLVRLLTGTLPNPDAHEIGGRVTLCDNAWSLPPDPTRVIEAGLHVVHQGDEMFPTLSIWKNVALGARTVKEYHAHRRQIIERLESELTAFVQEDRAPSLDDPLAELSGGARAYVRILRSLLWCRGILILDEPTVSLDPANQKRIHQRLREFWDGKISLLLVSHDQADHDALKKLARDQDAMYTAWHLDAGRLKTVGGDDAS